MNGNKCRINGQKGTNIEHSFQNDNIQKIFLLHINKQVPSVCAF